MAGRTVQFEQFGLLNNPIVKKYQGEGNMQKEIEQLINNNSGAKEICLSGNIVITVERNNSLTVGRSCVKGIINVMRPNVIVDGSNAQIEVNINDCTTGDWSLFYVHPSARNVQFRNLNIRIKIDNQVGSNRTFSIVYNTAFGLKIDNCNLEMISYKQLNMMGIYNNGNLDTHMDTRSDNLVVSDSTVRVECYADDEQDKDCTIYGIYNYLANSMSMQNTFVYTMNKGKSERQKAIGAYTNGRFGRFTGNNIKANATHNKGLSKEQAYACGFINEGLHSIITSNNIVGEWGGKCVGLENKGEYAIIGNNKILATHTVCGRSVCSFANNSLIQGNVLTSTSRNARLLVHEADNCVISRNYMEVLMAQAECRSGCGIYAIGMGNGNIISENIIRNVLDCGIFADKTMGLIINNRVVSYPETVIQADSDNANLKVKLSEDMIRSIMEN